MAGVLVRTGRISVRIILCLIILSALFFVSHVAKDVRAEAPFYVDDPNELSTTHETARVLSTTRREVLSRRQANQRIWEVVRQIETRDPDTGEITVDEIVSPIVEVGMGICYQDDQGGWQVTDASWRATDDGFAMDKAGYTLETGSTLGAWLNYTVDGEVMRLRPNKVVAFDGEQTAILALADGDVQGVIDADDAGRLFFADAFGSGIDLELQLLPSGFHQNVIFRSKPDIPAALNKAQTKIHLFTELDISGYAEDVMIDFEGPGGQPRKVAELRDVETAAGDIRFLKESTQGPGGSDRVFHRFVDSEVFDDGPVWSRKSTIASKSLVEEDGKRFLIETLDNSFLEDAVYPVVWDYFTRSGTLSTDTVWYARNTYYVSNALTVDGCELRIEPGTFVKFADSMYTRLTTSNNGRIIARGKPHMNVVFTSVNDNGNGEVIGPYSSGMPRRGDWLGIFLDDNSEFEFCSVLYSSFVNIKGCLAIPFQHNYLFFNSMSITVAHDAIGSEESLTIFNNLIVPNSPAMGTIGIGFGGSGNIYVSNNTIVGAYRGIEIGPSCEHNLNLYNNIYVSCDTGIKSYTGYGGSVSSTNDGFYNNTTNWDVLPGWSPTAPKYAGAYPFYRDPGFHDYLLNNNRPGGMDFVGKGSGTADSYYGNADDWAVFNIKAVASSRVFTSSQTIATDTTWHKQINTCDGGTVDLGFHAPRVDYIIDRADVTVNGTSSGATLTIKPGTVVVQNVNSSTGAGKLTIDGDEQGADSLVCVGDPAGDGYVTWVSLERARRSFGGAHVPYSNPKNNIEFEFGSDYDVRFTKFFGLGRALVPSEGGGTIRDCLFILNSRGIDYLSCSGFEVSNCLFMGNNQGIRDLSSSGGEIRGCTFDCNRYGISVLSEGTLDVSNCLFSGNVKDGGVGHGISYRSSSATLNESYNAFWGNDEDVYDVTQSESMELLEGSFVAGSDPYDSLWVDFDDRFRLDLGGDCKDGGDDPGYEGMAFYTTALDDRCDVPAVDIGYHYPGVVRFVDADTSAAEIDQDGLSWTTAYAYLQDALDEAGSTDMTGIAVAAGTYYPDDDKDSGHTEDSRYESFELVSDMGVYGGLTNSEWVFQERDPQGNVTILSGDIGTVGTDDTDNCYHVVTGADGAILDGFTITKGYADDEGTDESKGGGIYGNGTTATISNCDIYLNFAFGSGGGIYGSAGQISQCSIRYNVASYGGGISNESSALKVDLCWIYGNWAYYGGGIENYGAGSELTNCLIVGNEALNDGGGIENNGLSGGLQKITNCTITENRAGGNGGGLDCWDFDETDIENSIVWGNFDSGDNGVNNDGYDIYFANSSWVAFDYSNFGYYDSDETGGIYGAENLSTNPLFAVNGYWDDNGTSGDTSDDSWVAGDYHLQSVTGRWDGSGWVTDSITSLCIDAGDPAVTCIEPTPNGGIINMGVYGNTAQASKIDWATLTVDLATSTSGAQCTLIYNNQYYDGIWHDDGYEVQLRPGEYIIRLKPGYKSSNGLWYAADDITVNLASGDSETVTVSYWYSAVWVSADDGADALGRGGYTTPYATIQYGIDHPKNAQGTLYTVLVEYDTYYEHNIEFPSDKGITLKGINSVSGNKPIVDGETNRCFDITNSASDDTGITNFKIYGGNAIDGAGIRIRSCDAYIRNCIFSGNVASRYGGGIYIEFTTATVRDCTFESNSAQSGGAIYTWLCSPIFLGCDVGYTVGNRAPFSTSGSAEIYTYAPDPQVPTYRNCGIRGATYSNNKVYGSYCDYNTNPPIDGGGNY